MMAADQDDGPPPVGDPGHHGPSPASCGGFLLLGWRAADRRLSADDLRRIEVTVADAVPVWGPHPEGM
jgi:hypothetical protein